MYKRGKIENDVELVYGRTVFYILTKKCANRTTTKNEKN